MSEFSSRVNGLGGGLINSAPGMPPHFLVEKKMGEKIRKSTRLERERSHAKKLCETGAPALETTTEAVAPV